MSRKCGFSTKRAAVVTARARTLPALMKAIDDARVRTGGIAALRHHGDPTRIGLRIAMNLRMVLAGKEGSTTPV